MEGMSIKDITPIRVSFSEMHLALARGDVDAYVGAEPGPGVSLSSGIGKLVEYPYGTAMGGLNMVFGAHRDTLAGNPKLVNVILGIHRKAVEHAMKNPSELGAMAVAKLGQKKEAIEVSVPNVELTWKFGALEIQQAKTYAEYMLQLKQIRQLPDFAAFFDTKFVDELAKQA
jgi:ABC-type nitrate/sulfonate/bicarbonate transport system substrate-binding protein